MKHILAFICLALLAGCNRSVAKPDAEDQAPCLITEQEARVIASEQANTFLQDKTFGQDPVVAGDEVVSNTGTANTTWEGNRQPADGLPKPSR